MKHGEEEQEQEEQAAQGAGKREWGVPTNVAEAYARAAARVEQQTGRRLPQ